MSKDVKSEDFVRFTSEDVLYAAQSLMAASSIITAATDQYVHTGSMSVGALIHSSNVVDNVIERLNLAELAIEQAVMPF